MGYSIKFNAFEIDLLLKSTIIRNGVLNNSLFKINLSNKTPYSLMAMQENVGIKSYIMDKKIIKIMA